MENLLKLHQLIDSGIPENIENAFYLAPSNDVSIDLMLEKYQETFDILKKYNQIQSKELGFKALLEMANITYLNFGGATLETIFDFNGLVNLKFLKLWYNELNIIPDFKNLPNLKHLVLENNYLTEIPNFQYLRNLSYLDLGCNDLTIIPEFNNLINLNYLNLRQNKLTYSPNYKMWLPKLSKVYV